jgi:type II secretory pathway pseudopilin PulG
MNTSAYRSNGPNQRQAGFTLIEALISAVILAVGLLVIANFQGRVTTGSADAKARGEAIHLAQQQIERLRNEDLEVLIARQEDEENQWTHLGVLAEYEIIWELEGTDAQDLQAAEVTVSWENSRGEAEAVVLQTLIASSAYAGGVDPSAGAVAPPSGLQTPFGGGTIVRPGYTEDQRDEFKEGLEGSPDDFEQGPTTVENGTTVTEPPGGWPAGIPSGSKTVIGFDVDELGNVIALILQGDVSREVVDLNTGDTLVLLQGHEESSFRGLVYLRSDASFALEDVYVEGTPFALCVRGGAASGGSYETQAFVCYMAGGDALETFGWYGNVGVLLPEANNQDGVCVGAAGPSGAPLVQKSFRKYRGYRPNGDGVLVQVGIEPQRHFKGHNILVAGLSGNNTCASQLANIATINSAHPFWKEEGPRDNPPDEFCFTNPSHPENQEPTLDENRTCPDYAAPVLGPAECPEIGDLCNALSETYHDLVYVGNTATEWLFVKKANEPLTYTWAQAELQCDLGVGWSQLPGPPVAGESDILGSLFDNRGLFENRAAESVLPFVVNPAPSRYWTARAAQGQNRYFMDFSSGAVGTATGNNSYRVRCFYREALPAGG